MLAGQYTVPFRFANILFLSVLESFRPFLCIFRMILKGRSVRRTRARRASRSDPASRSALSAGLRCRCQGRPCFFLLHRILLRHHQLCRAGPLRSPAGYPDWPDAPFFHPIPISLCSFNVQGSSGALNSNSDSISSLGSTITDAMHFDLIKRYNYSERL